MLNHRPAHPIGSQDRQPQYPTTRHLTDLLVAVDDASGRHLPDVDVPARAVITPTPSTLRLYPPPGCERLHAAITADAPHADPAGVTFVVIVDDATVFDSGEQQPGDEPQQIDIDITGANRIDLTATSPGPGDSYAIWTNAHLACTG